MNCFLVQSQTALVLDTILLDMEALTSKAFNGLEESSKGFETEFSFSNLNCCPDVKIVYLIAITLCQLVDRFNLNLSTLDMIQYHDK